MMKDIIVNINRKSRQVSLSKATIGNDGENLQGNFIFKFDEFVDGQARLEYTFENEETKEYIILEKQSDSYICPIKSVITKEGKIFMQLVITQGIDEEEIPIFKCNVYYVYCNGSINAVKEAPEGYNQWIDVANTKLNQIDNVDIDIKNIDENVMVEITRKDGTKKSAIVTGGTGSGTSDYNDLDNKPKINNIELKGNKTLDELGIQAKGNYIEDENYVHTDNNFTDAYENKLNSLQNYDDTEIKNALKEKASINDMTTYIEEHKDELKGADGKDGTNGIDGYTPVKGVDYFDGKDGANGKDGADGKTPVKGTDYYTEADK